jgi:plasmid replication initiation protein
MHYFYQIRIKEYKNEGNRKRKEIQELETNAGIRASFVTLETASNVFLSCPGYRFQSFTLLSQETGIGT